MFLHFACHTYQTKISLSHNFPKFLYIISLSLYYQFVSYPAYVYDAYSLVQREFMAQLGYENVQAAGVEKTVVSPKIQQNILGVDYPVSVFAKAFQYFRLPVGEFHFRSGMVVSLGVLSVKLKAFPASALMRTISSCMPKGFFR